MVRNSGFKSVLINYCLILNNKVVIFFLKPMVCEKRTAGDWNVEL
jgi:hypothetical protein